VKGVKCTTNITQRLWFKPSYKRLW